MTGLHARMVAALDAVRRETTRRWAIIYDPPPARRIGPPPGEGVIDGVEYPAPHCDADVLHQPQGPMHVGALVSQDGVEWKLSILPIGEAPWHPGPARTTPDGHAPTATPPFVIRLTQPAWNALLSRATTTRSTASRRSPRRVRAAAAALPIERDGARVALLHGDALTPHQTADGANSLRPNAHESPSAVSSSALPGLNPAQTAEAHFLGTSWTLTTGKDAATQTRPSPNSPVPPSSGSSLSLPNAIWSVLSAIASELTSEQWLREQQRVKNPPCRFCDAYPAAQRARYNAGVNFTGQGNPRLKPCPSEARRPLELIERWAGNRSA